MITIIYTTLPKKGARKIETLLKRKLVGCVQFFPINSQFWWRGKIARASEVGVFLKTTKVNQTVAALKKIHPYKVPEIVIFRVKANKEYEKWLKSI